MTWHRNQMQYFLDQFRLFWPGTFPYGARRAELRRWFEALNDFPPHCAYRALSTHYRDGDAGLPPQLEQLIALCRALREQDHQAIATQDPPQDPAEPPRVKPADLGPEFWQERLSGPHAATYARLRDKLTGPNP